MKVEPDKLDGIGRLLLIAFCIVVIVCINLLHS
jgi:hypothetical protein